jgi:hypothetical protein
VFVTKKSVVVPAGSVKVSGQKDAVITAQIPGTRSNVGLTDFQLIKPMKGITVRGVTPVSGGIQSTDRTVSPEIDSQIRTELTQSFDSNDVLVQRMKEELPDTMLALPISFIAGEPSFSYSSEGESSVMITAQKRIVITMVARSDIAQLLGSRMSAPENNKLTLDSFDGLTVTTTALGSPTNIPKTLPIRITGVGTVYGSIDQKSLIDQITGKSKSETKAILAQKSEIGTFDIHMMPFWRRILPLDAEKISVTVLNP